MGVVHFITLCSKMIGEIKIRMISVTRNEQQLKIAAINTVMLEFDQHGKSIS